jgi:metal-responsive CopG/Arc/MetJ family transcriptional regulator
MRQVLSLSLPKKVTEEIKTFSKKRGFSSVSAYIKYLIDSDKDLISETGLLNSIKQARIEYKKGETLKVESIKNLL